jgi:hypothetical protein
MCRYMLWPFGIFCGHLVYFYVHLVYFYVHLVYFLWPFDTFCISPCFVVLYQEKSGNPVGMRVGNRLWNVEIIT